MLIRILLVTCSLLVAPALHAEKIADEFFARGSQIPQTLKDMGYEQFGDLKLSSALERMPSIAIVYSDKVRKLNNNLRLSAHWQIDENGVATIFVNQNWWNKFYDQKLVLALHEYLGPLGFIDDQYWMSVSMWFLSLPQAQIAFSKDPKLKPAVVAWIGRNANWRLPKGTKVAGGAIGVGGGGEGGTLFIKMNGILRSLQELSQPQAPADEAVSLGMIYHYLSSQTTVYW